MNYIAECTKNCPREDCSITCSITGGDMWFSTLMGWIPTYDKNGNRTDPGDPNIRSTEVRCSVCEKHWRISEQYGDVTVTECTR
jgi:hypothetical protein